MLRAVPGLSVSSLRRKGWGVSTIDASDNSATCIIGTQGLIAKLGSNAGKAEARKKLPVCEKTACNEANDQSRLT